MKILILLCLVSMVTGHYGRYDDNRYDDYIDEDEYDMEDDRYDDDFDRPSRRHYDDMEDPRPFRRRHIMKEIISKVSAAALKPTDQNINLKVSGMVELVKSFKGSHNPWEHWMKEKMNWMKHIHQHLHNMDKFHHHEHHDDTNDDDHDGDHDDDDNDEDEQMFHTFKSPGWKKRENCPFWITQQFLKLCKCPTINGMMGKLMGHQVKPFDHDPMLAFNNTPGMEELLSGNINKLLTMVHDLKPRDVKKLFYAGMIQSMCKEAKTYVREAQKFQKAAQARAKATIITATKKLNLMQRNLANPPHVPLANQYMKGDNSKPDKLASIPKAQAGRKV